MSIKKIFLLLQIMLVITIIFIIIVIGSRQKESLTGKRHKNLSDKVIQARVFMDLQNIGTEFEINKTFFQTKLFHITEDLTTYLIDSKRNRILEINNLGKIEKIIGGPGQKEGDLYYPLAITANDNILAIINNSGGEIKFFRRSGALEKIFSKKNGGFQPVIILRSHNEFIASVRNFNRSIEEMNNEPLFSLFDYDFNQIKSFGRVIKCSSLIAHLHFNLIELCISDKYVFGAFIFLPIIFAFDINNGNEILYRDLSIMQIPEIEAGINRQKEIKADTPEEQTKPNEFKAVRFNQGVAFYKGILYYLRANHKFLLFDQKGEFLGRMFVHLNNRDITPYIDCFVILPSGKMYGLVSYPENKETFIFEAVL